jgi:hypothetical protein
VARQLAFLGDHLLMLTSMNLRDYLALKVELEGTSGAGSTQVGWASGRGCAARGAARLWSAP